MTILVTAASGHLGRLIVESLLERGVAASDVVAGSRSLDKVAELADRGVRTAVVDYDAPETLDAAFAGVDRVVLVSGSEVGKRLAQHQAVIDAAVAAKVGGLVYTSLYHATTSPLPLAAEHVATEEALAASGLRHTILRNNWYIENYAQDVARAAESGVIAAAVADGKVAAAARADYAEAAAVVATDDAYLGRVLELAGDVAFGYADLAAAAAEIHGRDVTYVALSEEHLLETLRGVGLDEGTAGFVAALDAGIAAGALDSEDRTLSQLIGRPTTPLVDGLRAAL
ncbi:NmrA family NAD(P)-binding protein [Microbacterium sp. Clip185]|uniref:NmrA family NAD(P)-binding protein n=1 Tax=Microbacterium sp. Clip185 TaxID=3025663 RepID=UPI00236527DA|nr:NmrA family NAD(P)-binding protein [Microbacterium sp. Clip185]WDG18081.1 NmrA family NAD(P)-binding protein [Microbacterium sp. Clip185]